MISFGLQCVGREQVVWVVAYDRMLRTVNNMKLYISEVTLFAAGLAWSGCAEEEPCNAEPPCGEYCSLIEAEPVDQVRSVEGYTQEVMEACNLQPRNFGCFPNEELFVLEEPELSQPAETQIDFCSLSDGIRYQYSGMEPARVRAFLAANQSMFGDITECFTQPPGCRVDNNGSADAGSDAALSTD